MYMFLESSIKFYSVWMVPVSSWSNYGAVLIRLILLFQGSSASTETIIGILLSLPWLDTSNIIRISPTIWAPISQKFQQHDGFILENFYHGLYNTRIIHIASPMYPGGSLFLLCAVSPMRSKLCASNFNTVLFSSLINLMHLKFLLLPFVISSSFKVHLRPFRWVFWMTR